VTKETIKVYATYREVALVGRFLSGELKEGSAENLTARRVLARLLRRPEQQLDLGLRWALAKLFDPDPPPLADGEGRCGKEDEQPFMLHLKRRRRGRPEKEMTESQIAEFIWQQRYTQHRQMQDVIDDVKKMFGTGRRRAFEIWKRWQPILQRSRRRPLNLRP
jgi:hypothetical protein